MSLRFLITTGPTREYLDAVRFVSNPSSGRMGFATARAAVAAGHAATVIAGPTHLPPPEGAEAVHVVSTQDMLEACMARLDGSDVLVAAAAPCDFRPAERFSGKLKKGAASLALNLEPTPDILLEASRSKGNRVLIGFALEAQDPRVNALGKLRRKNLDAIVLNDPSAFGADKSSATIFRADGTEETLEGVSKEELGKRLVRLAEEIWGSRKDAWRGAARTDTDKH